MTNEDIDYMVEWITSSKEGRQMPWQQLPDLLFDGAFTYHMIKYALRSRGYRRFIGRRKPPLTEAHRMQRLAFTRAHLHDTFQ